jgi:hypothetical protein
MTPEELGRIRRIYEQALPMGGSAREAYVRQECQDQEDIRAEIERLLKAHDNLPDWLERPALGAARIFASLDPPKLEGRSLSGYTLIRETAPGGHQADTAAGRLRRDPRPVPAGTRNSRIPGPSEHRQAPRCRRYGRGRVAPAGHEANGGIPEGTLSYLPATSR